MDVTGSSEAIIAARKRALVAQAAQKLRTADFGIQTMLHGTGAAAEALIDNVAAVIKPTEALRIALTMARLEIASYGNLTPATLGALVDALPTIPGTSNSSAVRWATRALESAATDTVRWEAQREAEFQSIAAAIRTGTP